MKVTSPIPTGNLGWHYIVTIEWRDDRPPFRGSISNLLPREYATTTRSPLRVIVQAKSNQLAPFEIRDKAR